MPRPSSSNDRSSSSGGGMQKLPHLIPRPRARSNSYAKGQGLSRPAPPSGLEDKMLARLIIFGWITALLYFPSGLLHGVLGPVVYLRDLMLGFHIAASILWLVKNNQLVWVASHSWVILITPVMLIPAVMDGNYTLEALRTCKFSVSWLDWIILGHLLRLNKNWGQWLKPMIVITLIMMTAELVAGAIEWHTGEYLFPTTWGETTAFGVQRGNDQALEGEMRIRGLQRDVFSFANIMAMNAVVGMAYFTSNRDPARRIAASVWIGAFGLLMIVSGGRSALFGATASFVYMIYVLTLPSAARIYARRYVLAWLLIAVAMSAIGVGKFTDFVGGQLLVGSHIGDAQSAYMRDAYWVQMWSDFLHQPLILVLGGPFASIIDSRTSVMFHWADNQLLWNTYHLGLTGSLAIIFFFYKVLEPEPAEGDRLARQTLILFLVFVLGEGIARESMTFIGCTPLFVLCGYDSANAMKARRSSYADSPFRRIRQSQGGPT